MDLTAEIKDGQVWFRIVNADPRYFPVFRRCYYLEDDQGFYKVYPESYPNLEVIQKNFIHHGEDMFNQLGYFSPIPWEEGLESFIKRVDRMDIGWWLTGSCAVCVRGIRLMPHDVDIVVNSSDIPALMELFKGDIFEPIVSTEGWVTKDFGVLFLACRIDIASDPASCLDDPEPVDCGPYAKMHLEVISWRGHLISIPPLALSIAVNKKRKRWDRVRLMEDYQSKA